MFPSNSFPFFFLSGIHNPIVGEYQAGQFGVFLLSSDWFVFLIGISNKIRAEPFVVFPVTFPRATLVGLML